MLSRSLVNLSDAVRDPIAHYDEAVRLRLDVVSRAHFGQHFVEPAVIERGRDFFPLQAYAPVDHSRGRGDAIAFQLLAERRFIGDEQLATPAGLPFGMRIENVGAGRRLRIDVPRQAGPRRIKKSLGREERPLFPTLANEFRKRRGIVQNERDDRIDTAPRWINAFAARLRRIPFTCRRDARAGTRPPVTNAPDFLPPLRVHGLVRLELRELPERGEIG